MNENQKYFIRKYILAVLVLGMIFVYSAVNIVMNFETYGDGIEAAFEDAVKKGLSVRETVSSVETVLTDNAYRKMDFLEIYSFTHKLLGKEEIKDFAYIKDREGNLNYAAFYREKDDQMFEYAMRVKRLSDEAAKKGTKVLFVITPSKYDHKYSRFSKGLPYNDMSDRVDSLMFYLNRMEIPTINYADHMPSKGVPYEGMFFGTDHHWTMDTAFAATRILVDEMDRQLGIKLDGEQYLDIDRFDRVLYRDAMIGSLGRGSGVCFAGLDDFVAFYPKWETHFFRESTFSGGNTETYTGGYKDTIIDETVFMEKTPYKNRTYSLYMNGIRPFEHLVNLDTTGNEKILMVRDSYFSPVMAFMAPMVKQIDAIWTLEQTEDVTVEKVMEKERYDCIIVEVYPYNLNETAFQFFEETTE